MTIALSSLWPIENQKDYKVHFARWNGNFQPLDVFVSDRERWQHWQEHYPGRNHFNRPYIFSLMQFYHETDTWLFGGVYHVLGFENGRYNVNLEKDGAPLIGRLKLHAPYKQRATRVNLEKHYDTFEVSEILREPYTGRQFPGYEAIDISFEELEALVKNDRMDWKAALENTKGIYLITDQKTGKRYVGSAYGESGIWSRWSSYVASGHGGNKELRELVRDPSLDYCRANFRFALLEHRPERTPDEAIIQRESFWKSILLTREYGLNRN
jgi:hypothetical protein